MTDADPTSTAKPDKLASEERRDARRSIAETLANDTRAQLLEIALVFSPAVIALVTLRAIGPDNPMIFMAGIWLANLTMLGLIWVGIRVRGQSCRSIGLNVSRAGPADVFRAILKSIPITIFTIASFVLGTVLMVNVVGRPEAADMTKYNYLQGNLPLLLVSLAGVYVVSSFGEEVVYRGFLITRLERMFGGKSRRTALFALATSSTVFGLAHFEWGVMGIVQTTCMGIALGVSFLFTKRTLWPLILAHAYMDTILLAPLYFA